MLGWIHWNMLGDEKKTLVSTLENQKENSCENSSARKKIKNKRICHKLWHLVRKDMGVNEHE